MGRSVSYPSSALVAFSVIEVEDRDANEHDLVVQYEWLRGDLAERAAAALPSLAPTMAGVGAKTGSLWAGEFAAFEVSVYGGLVAASIAERDDGAYWDPEWRTARSSRAQRWLRQIVARIDAVFGEYDCLGHMSNGEGVYQKRVAA